VVAGDSFLIRAVAEATGRSVAKIKHDVENAGDLGTVAEVMVFNFEISFSLIAWTCVVLDGESLLQTKTFRIPVKYIIYLVEKAPQIMFELKIRNWIITWPVDAV